MKPRLQYRLQDDKGGVFVNGLDNPVALGTGGEVETWVAMLKGDVLSGGGREQCGHAGWPTPSKKRKKGFLLEPRYAGMSTTS